MSIDELTEESLEVLAQQWPCREAQLRSLRLLLSPRLPSASTIIVQGPQATGKSSILAAHLKASGLLHVVVKCEECITERHLLERTVALVEDVLDAHHGRDASTHSAKCESINALSSQLQDNLRDQGKFVIVFDGIDKQREASTTLAPALARLGEVMPDLVTVMVVRDSSAGAWRRSGLPHVVFPPYSRAEAVHIVSLRPEDIYGTEDVIAQDYDDRTHEEDKVWLWPRFCAAVWDSLGQSAARDLVSFKELCVKLWRPFLQPVLAGDLGTRDFSRLMVSRRQLFQSEDILLDHLIETDRDATTSRLELELPYFARWTLLAAFLASTIPARLDATYFMKSTEKKKRKKGSGIARLSSKSAQNNKIPRHLMAPMPFSLDRLLAIMHAIIPEGIKTSLDTSTQITTLTSLRLLARSTGFGLGDAVEAGSKWKIGPAITWEYASGLAGSLDFNLADYTLD